MNYMSVYSLDFQNVLKAANLSDVCKYRVYETFSLGPQGLPRPIFLGMTLVPIVVVLCLLLAL